MSNTLCMLLWAAALLLSAVGCFMELAAFLDKKKKNSSKGYLLIAAGIFMWVVLFLDSLIKTDGRVMIFN